jgi:nucleotide-binding universal stress UspA family protein
MIEKRGRILCAVDFGRLSLLAADYAAELAANWDTELTLLHVHTFPMLATSTTVITESAASVMLETETLRERLSMVCRGVVAKTPCKASYDVELVEGSVADTIADYAKCHSCALVVMGSHSRPTIVRFFVGDTAAGVLKKVSMPALFIPDPEAST